MCLALDKGQHSVRMISSREKSHIDVCLCRYMYYFIILGHDIENFISPIGIFRWPKLIYSHAQHASEPERTTPTESSDTNFVIGLRFAVHIVYQRIRRTTVTLALNMCVIDSNVCSVERNAIPVGWKMRILFRVRFGAKFMSAINFHFR